MEIQLIVKHFRSGESPSYSATHPHPSSARGNIRSRLSAKVLILRDMRGRERGFVYIT